MEPLKGHVSNCGPSGPKKSEPNFIILIISVYPWLFFTSLFYVLWQLIFSGLGYPPGIEENFCRHFLRCADSWIELSVLMTNITLFLKIDRIIANIWSSFWDPKNQYLTWRSMKTQFRFVENRSISCRIIFSTRNYMNLLTIESFFNR